VYLLDTNIVSELRRARPHGAVRAWIQSAADADLRISAVTIGELQAGIEMTRRRDEARAAELEAWLDQIVSTFNIVSMDGPTFRCFAKLMDRRSRTLLEDAMIAASAIVNRLIVVTRNTRDFEPFGVRTLNPFQSS
jgi:predicted nucleic acid-binding protein